MDINAAHTLALKTMNEHGLIEKGWTFKWGRALSYFGMCSHSRKTITLSKPLTEVNSEDHVMDTILHETAHALAGPHAGHGVEWKKIARQLGANPSPVSTGVSAPSKYFAVCGCGAKFERNRLPSTTRYCAKCYKSGLKVEGRLMWIDRKTLAEAGFSTQMNLRYPDLTSMVS